MKKLPAIYIMANTQTKVLYVGVTADLITRIQTHKKQNNPACFTYRNKCTTLVYVELHTLLANAIEGEKQLKSGSREKKLQLINKVNSNWDDLYDFCATMLYFWK